MVDVLTVRISWPHQVENNKPQGKWLLYLTSHPVVKNGAGSCRLPPGYFPNPLNLSSYNEMESVQSAQLRQPNLEPDNLWHPDSELLESGLESNAEKYRPGEPPEYLAGSSRSKREVERIVSPLVVRSDPGDPDDPGQLVVRLDCDRGTAKCLPITCQIYNLKANNSFTIEIKSRLWNATLVEDYSNIDRVEILSKASVIIDPVYTQDVSNDYRSITTIALPDHQLEPLQSPSWWIYVVAAVCGVLLLVIIILILSKCGFFKRKRPEEDDFLMSANFEKVRLNGDMMWRLLNYLWSTRLYQIWKITNSEMDECKNTEEIRDGRQLARPGDAAGQPWDLERGQTPETSDMSHGQCGPGGNMNNANKNYIQTRAWQRD